MKKFILISFLFFLLVVSTVHAEQKTEDKICVYYFYGQGCSACAKTTPYISELESKYPQVRFNKLEIWYNQTNRDIFYKFCDVYCVSEKFVPIVFIDDKFLVGVQPIKENLENEIKNCINFGCVCPEEKVKNATIVPKLEVTIPIIITAALIDSINPCAFAVLIFLLTYLIALGARQKILKVGFAYIFVVFTTYFLAGLGLFATIQAIGITQLIYKVAAIIAIVAGAINVKDYFFYGKGFSLEIPKSKKPLLEKYIHNASIPAALILGFLVSVFELPCTGAVYLAILSMLANQMTRMMAIPYLLFYNLIFVMPLFTILGFVYKGISADRVEKWRVEKRKYMKLIAGLFLIVIGVIMLLELV